MPRITFLLVFAATVGMCCGCSSPDENSSQFRATEAEDDEAAWEQVKTQNSFEAALEFIKKYPDSKFVAEARSTFGHHGTSDYEPESFTIGLYLASGELYAIAAVSGPGDSDSGEDVPIEEGLSMLRTTEDQETWYAIVSSEQEDAGIRVITENLRSYLIEGISYNFTGRIRPLD